jgi:hypothetical protein
VSITGSQTLDFHVPDFRFEARVYDAEDGRAVQGTIALRSIYVGANGRESDVLAIRTADSGITPLPPVRPGTVELRVAADGYLESDPITLTVDEAPSPRVVDVPMRRARETVRLDIRLADGRPAGNAEVALWTGGADLKALTTADAQGVANVPASMTGSIVLVRHPAGGSGAFPFDVSTGNPPILQLPPPAPPLVLRVRDDRSGTGIVPARLTAWFNGRPVSGTALAFLAWSSSDSSHAGVWMARNLPARPLRIVATSAASQIPHHATALEAVAEVIPFPWPDVPSVTVSR